jgi:hypothetical protein
VENEPELVEVGDKEVVVVTSMCLVMTPPAALQLDAAVMAPFDATPEANDIAAVAKIHDQTHPTQMTAGTPSFLDNRLLGNCEALGSWGMQPMADIDEELLQFEVASPEDLIGTSGACVDRVHHPASRMEWQDEIDAVLLNGSDPSNVVFPRQCRMSKHDTACPRSEPCELTRLSPTRTMQCSP